MHRGLVSRSEGRPRGSDRYDADHPRPGPYAHDCLPLPHPCRRTSLDRPERSHQPAGETDLNELGLSRCNPRFSLVSDGDHTIEGAVRQCLPGARLDRCTWHILHNVGEWLRERYPLKEQEGKRRGLMVASRSTINATEPAPWRPDSYVPSCQLER
jgi:hypothetical protein